MSPRAERLIAGVTGWLKIVAFAVGVIVLASFGIAEALSRLGLQHGPCTDAGVPWGQLIVGGILVGPTMLGPARITRVILAGLSGVTRMVARDRASVTPTEPPPEGK